MEINGFGAAPMGVPARWTKEHKGRTYTFGKERKPTHFVYYCERTSGNIFTQDTSTGYKTDRDLSREEIEKLPLFVEFMEGTT
ncbi:MAG: hypothetical protein WB630_14150 [Candidatus Acidiferrales bacterium]